MELQSLEHGRIGLRVSLPQLKVLYTALFCQIQTGGCHAFDEIDEDDMLLKLQDFLQREAAAQGVDCTNHAEWEAFLGISHPASCPRRGSPDAGSSPARQE